MSVAARTAQAAPAAADAPPREVMDRVVAVIDNEIITWRELEAKATPFFEQLNDIKDVNAQATRRQEILKQVLDIEIGDRIVDKEIEGNRDRLAVTDKDIDKAVDEVTRMNHLSREQLQSALYSQGLTWTEYRAKLRSQLERARLIQFKVQGKVQIKDADVRRRCQERQRAGTQQFVVCASHVLLAVNKNMPPDAVEAQRIRASKLQSELAAGADFAAYALKYSDDKSAPDGQLGCFHAGEMVEAFEQAAFALAVGHVSAVVQTPFGFHIIKVYDKRTASSASTCQAEAELEPFRNELYQEEMQRQMSTWVDELRKKAFVEVRL